VIHLYLVAVLHRCLFVAISLSSFSLGSRLATRLAALLWRVHLTLKDRPSEIQTSAPNSVPTGMTTGRVVNVGAQPWKPVIQEQAPCETIVER